jgi:hypothetical protein
VDQERLGRLRAHLQTLKKFGVILAATKDEAMDTGFVITMMHQWKAMENDLPGAVSPFSNASFRVPSIQAQLARAEDSIVRLIEQERSQEGDKAFGTETETSFIARGKVISNQKERAVDFLGENLFPPHHPSHSLWRENAIAAAEEHARFQSKRAARVIKNAQEFLEFKLEGFTGRFDITAKWLARIMVNSYDGAEAHIEALALYSKQILDSASHNCHPEIREEDLLAELRIRLLQRTEYYKAESLRCGREAEARRKRDEKE